MMRSRVGRKVSVKKPAGEAPRRACFAVDLCIWRGHDRLRTAHESRPESINDDRHKDVVDVLACSSDAPSQACIFAETAISASLHDPNTSYIIAPRRASASRVDIAAHMAHALVINRMCRTLLLPPPRS